MRLKKDSGPEKGERKPAPLSAESAGGGGRYVYLCRDCYSLVTSQLQETKVNSRHVHIFPNPHGLVFEIGCFLDAVCFTLGQPSTEFTWFPGYAWDIAMCISCRRHLGWMYTNKDRRFYGLVLQALLKREIKGADI
ncbi:MAG: cereblon family protein [Desulfonatronovibrionaceae bacterium]